jgi:putative DNA primase/helicase
MESYMKLAGTTDQVWLPRLTPEIDLLQFDLHDSGNAQRIVAKYGRDLLYDVNRKKWLRWDGQRWRVDAKQAVRNLAKLTMGAFFDAAVRKGDEAKEKFARASLNAKRLEYALSLAQPSLAAESIEFDKNPWLLNFQNGTLDLRDGSFRSHLREDLITKVIPHDFNRDAECPQWLGLLNRMMGDSQDLVNYLQLAFGYSLTGSTREKVVFFLYGPGGTGKTTMLTAFREAMGEDYGTLIQITTLLAGRDNNATNADLADLCGARFAMSSEPDPGAKLSPSKLKRLTQGMGKVKARRLYENPFSFEETHHLWVDCNDRPAIPGADPATFSRLHPIPCLVQIPKDKVDRGLITKLRDEAGGILSWAAKGAQRWYEQGLPRPSQVEASAESWRDECDNIQQFITERCDVDEKFSVQGSRIYAAYKAWCEGRREDAFTATAFGLRLTARFVKYHTNKGVKYKGITVRDFGETEAAGDE